MLHRLRVGSESESYFFPEMSLQQHPKARVVPVTYLKRGLEPVAQTYMDMHKTLSEWELIWGLGLTPNIENAATGCVSMRNQRRDIVLHECYSSSRFLRFS